jgi:hypothetical protein
MKFFSAFYAWVVYTDASIDTLHCKPFVSQLCVRSMYIRIWGLQGCTGVHCFFIKGSLWCTVGLV